MKNKIKEYNCPVGVTLSLIGGKYKVIILWYLFKNKILRFNELQKIIPKVTPKMLIQQLRELESDKMIIRTVYPVVPPKVEYSLTELGESIIPILEAMNEWGDEYQKKL